MAENLRQRGVTDLEAEGERRRKAAAKAYDEGRTWRQRAGRQAPRTRPRASPLESRDRAVPGIHSPALWNRK